MINLGLKNSLTSSSWGTGPGCILLFEEYTFGAVLVSVAAYTFCNSRGHLDSHAGKLFHTSDTGWHQQGSHSRMELAQYLTAGWQKRDCSWQWEYDSSMWFSLSHWRLASVCSGVSAASRCCWLTLTWCRRASLSSDVSTVSRCCWLTLSWCRRASLSSDVSTVSRCC